MTPEDTLKALVYAHYQAYGIAYQQRKILLIEASRDHACEECEAGPYQGCLNRTDIKRGIQPPRLNKLPHESRIDWKQAKQALWRRGMWRESLVKLTMVKLQHEEERRQRGRQKGPEELPLQD